MHPTWFRANSVLKPTWFRADPTVIFMYYVYVLKSQSDGKLYTGYTTHLENRIREHNAGEVDSTKGRRPLDLVFFEGYKGMEDAKRRERCFKTTRGKSSLRMMLQDSLK